MACSRENFAFFESRTYVKIHHWVLRSRVRFADIRWRGGNVSYKAGNNTVNRIDTMNYALISAGP